MFYREDSAGCQKNWNDIKAILNQGEQNEFLEQPPRDIFVAPEPFKFKKATKFMYHSLMMINSKVSYTKLIVIILN